MGIFKAISNTKIQTGINVRFLRSRYEIIHIVIRFDCMD